MEDVVEDVVELVVVELVVLVEEVVVVETVLVVVDCVVEQYWYCADGPEQYW